MKIIIANYQYFSRNGPGGYMFKVKELLEKHGHTVIPFAINYEDNEKTAYVKYFVDPVGDKKLFRYSENNRLSLKNKIAITRKLFYNKNAYEKLKSLIHDEAPDVIYVLQFWGKLSVSIFDACLEKKIPIVLRLSDYGLICSKNIFFRDGAICTKCIQDPVYSVLYRCVQDSYAKSLLMYIALKCNYSTHFIDKVSAIVTPSLTMKKTIARKKEFRELKIIHIPTFVPIGDLPNGIDDEHDIEYLFCYFGRISDDKGVHVLIDAMSVLKGKGVTPKTLIIGDNNNQYSKELIKKCRDQNMLYIDFVGQMERKSLLQEIKKARFCIVPSVWYDNMPNCIIESQSQGLPVIASNIGSLAELIKNNSNGFLFKTGDKTALADCLEVAMKLDKNAYRVMRKNSLDWVSSYCSEERHYQELITVFESLVFAGDNNENSY